MPSRKLTPPNEALRRARRQQGWSQEDVAARLGTNAFTVARWELGMAFPRPYYRQKLVDLFAQPPASLGLVPPAPPTLANGSHRPDMAIPSKRRSESAHDLWLPSPILMTEVSGHQTAEQEGNSELAQEEMPHKSRGT